MTRTSLAMRCHHRDHDTDDHVISAYVNLFDTKPKPCVLAWLAWPAGEEKVAESRPHSGTATVA
jgi:hypothetical protein